MTTQNIVIISDALIELAVNPNGVTPTAEQGAHALRKLNQMLETWEDVDNIRLGWFEQTDTSADSPLPPYAERGVTLALAMALASSYGGAASITPALIKEHDETYGAICKKAALANLQEKDTSNMNQAEGRNTSGYDITRGF